MLKQQIDEIRASIGKSTSEGDSNMLNEKEFYRKFIGDSIFLKNIFGLEKLEKNGHYPLKKNKDLFLKNNSDSIEKKTMSNEGFEEVRNGNE